MRVKKICVMLGLLLVVACGAWGADSGDFRWGTNASGEWNTDLNWTYKNVINNWPQANNDYPGKDGKNGDGNLNDEVYLNTTSSATNDNIVIKLVSDISIANLYLETSSSFSNITIDLNGFNLTVSNNIYIGNKDQSSSDKVIFTITGAGTLSADAVHVASSSTQSSVRIENHAACTIINSVNNSSASQSGKFSITGDGTGTFDYQGSANVDSFMNVDTSALANSSGNFFVATNEFRWTGAVDSDWTKAANWQQKGTIGSTVSYSAATRYPGSQGGDTADFTANAVEVTNLSLEDGVENLTIENNSSSDRLGIANCGTNSKNAKILLKGTGETLLNAAKFNSLTLDENTKVLIMHSAGSSYSLEVENLTLNKNSQLYGNTGAVLNVNNDLNVSGSLCDGNSNQKIKTLNVGGKTVISGDGEITLSACTQTYTGSVTNNGNMNLAASSVIFNGGVTDTGNTLLSTGSITYNSESRNEIYDLSVSDTGTVKNLSSSPVYFEKIDCGIKDVRFEGNFEAAEAFNFKASSAGTYFINGNVDFSQALGTTSFDASGGTIYFYQTEGDSVAKRTFSTKSDTAFNDLYFGGNVEIVMNGAVTAKNVKREAVTNDYKFTNSTESKITGTGQLTVAENFEISRVTDSDIDTFILDEKTELNGSSSYFVHHSGMIFEIAAGKSLTIPSDYRGFGDADGAKNEIIVNGTLNVGTDFGAGQSNEALVTVNSGGKLTVGGNIAYASKFTNKGTVDVTGSITGVKTLENQAGTVTVGDSISGMVSLQNWAGAELAVTKSTAATNIFNGGILKTASLSSSGTLNSCTDNTTSLIEFTDSGTLSLNPMNSNTLTNIKVDAGKTLTLGSPVSITGNVENNGTILANSGNLYLSGTVGNLSQITGTGTFIVAKDNFSGEYLSIGDSVTIKETAAAGVVYGSHKAYAAPDKTSRPAVSTSPEQNAYISLFKNGWDLGYEFTYTWKGTTQAWSTATNWEPELVPGISANNTAGAKVLIPDGCDAWPQIYTAQINLSSLTIGTSTSSSHGAKIIINVDGSGSSGGGSLNIENTDATLPLLTNYGTIEYKGASRITNGTDPLNDALHGGTVEYSGTGQTVTNFSSTGPSYANLKISGTGAQIDSDLELAGLLTVGAGADVALAADKTLSLGGNLLVNGSLSCGDGSTVLFNGAASPQTVTASSAASASLQFANVEIDPSASVTTASSFTVTENWTNGNAAGNGFTATLGSITFSGDAVVSGQNTFYEATFSKAGGNIEISGSNTFNSLNFTGSGLTAKFAAGKTQTVTSSFSSKGADGSEITLTTASSSPSESDRTSWWILDLPSGVGTAILADDFKYTKISYSESKNVIAHAWADSVAEDVADSTINWFISDYYWLGGTDSSWASAGNWSFKISGSYVAAGKAPNYTNGRNSIFIDTAAGGNNLILEDGIFVKSISVLAGKTIDLKGFTVTCDDSDSSTNDFENNGTVRLLGIASQIRSSVLNGSGSTIEYYNDSGTPASLTLSWGQSYENLIFADGAGGAITAPVTVSGNLKILNGSGNELSLTGANSFANPVTIGDSANSLSGGKITLNSDGNLQLAEVTCDSIEVQSSVEFTQDVDSKINFSGDNAVINGNGKIFSEEVLFSGAQASLLGDNSFISSVEFSADTKILGENSFADFICKTAATHLVFAGGKTQGVSGNFVLKGQASSHIIIESDAAASEWNLSPSDVEKFSLSYVTVRDSKNTAAAPIIIYAKDGYNTDGTGNTNWIFAGQEYVWTGLDLLSPTEWEKPSNWSPASVPGRYAEVKINELSSQKYPVLVVDINLYKGEKTFVLDDDGDGITDHTEKAASSVSIGDNVVFDFNGFNLTANSLRNSGRIRVKGSETIVSSGTSGIENLPLDANSFLTGTYEYYGNFGSALNWGTSFNQLEFTEGASGSEIRALSVRERLLISNGSGNDLALTGNNVFADGVKITSAGSVTLSGAADSLPSPTPFSIFGESERVTCDSLTINSRAKFESNIILDVPSVSFGEDVSGSGFVNFKGNLSSFGDVAIAASYVLFDGNPDRSVSVSSSGKLVFDCDTFVDMALATLTLASDLEWTKNFCLYSGNISIGSVNISGKNFLAFGSAYNADDPRYSGSDTRFALWDYASLPYHPVSGAAGFNAILASNSGKITLSGNFYANGLDLSGLNLSLPDSSASRPLFNNSSSVTERQWGLPYAVVFNSEISGCSASASSGSAFVAASRHQNVVDSSAGSGNPGFQFALPQISEAYSVSDSAVCIKFDMALENSASEVSETVVLISSLEQGGIFYNGKSLAFDGKFYTEFDGENCLLPLADSSLASTDIPEFTPLYLKVSSAENKWNTDATAALAGSDESTDRSGTHRNVTTDLSFFEGLFYAAQGKTMCRNYGIGLWKEESATAYEESEIFATKDMARPVLVDFFAGQELHATNTGLAESQKFYDSHNFIELRYSEPVDIGDLSAGSENSNRQAESEFDSALKHGGAILNNSGESGGFTVAGFVSVEKGQVTAGYKSGNGRSFTGEIDSARPHALYRKFSLKAGSEEENFACRVRIAVAGYVDEANPVQAGGNSFHNWRGYIESSSSPSGSVIPLANAFITDLAEDGDGNRLYNVFDENNSSRSILVNDRAPAAEDSLYGEWDCLHPVFAPYVTNFDDSEPGTSWNSGDSANRQYEMLGTVDSNTNAYIDKIELHLFDNKPAYSAEDSYKWASGKGWMDASGSLLPGFTAPENSGGSRAIPASSAMTLGGIRRSSLEAADSAFSYTYSLDSFESEKRSFAESEISQHVKSSMFRIEELSETFTEDDGPYLGISINPEDSRLPIRTSFTVTYNPDSSFITDLAGNRLLQRDAGSGVKVLHTIDITPPSFSMTISPVGENKIYAVFTKPLAYKGTYLHELGGELDSVLSKIVSNIEFVYSEEDNVDTRSVPEGESAISVLSAELVSKTNDFTALLFTLSRKVSLDDVEKIWLRVNDSGEATESLFGNITASFIQDKFGNPVPAHTCHALSDFAVNAVNVLYAYADSFEDDDWSEESIYGEGLAPFAQDYALHEFTEDGQNYNLLRSGRDIVFQLEFVNFDDGNEKSGAVNGESLALVYDEKSRIRQEWKSNKFNLFTGSEWRLWLDNNLDALSTGFNSEPLSASLPALSPAFENVGESEILKNMRWQNDAFNLSAGKEYQFFFKILDASGNIIRINHDGDKTTGRIPLYAFRMPKERIAAGDFSFIDLWSFRTKDITRQRGGVSILNNVINASVGEKTAIEVNMKSDGNLNVFVMTLDGNIVRRLSKGTVKAGTHYFYWDGKNNAGKSVARGLYFVRVSGKDIDETRKVMVIKK